MLNHSSSSGEVRVGEDISTIHIDANTNTAATARDKNMDNTGPNNPDMNRVKQQQQQDSQDFTRMPIPPIPVSFPNLHDMNEISLQRLLNDPHALELHVEQRSEIKELENMRDMLALQVCLSLHTIAIHYYHMYMYVSFTWLFNLSGFVTECSTSRTQFETN